MIGHLPPLPRLLAEILVLFLAIGLHEYAHCKFADMAGDPTPRMYGRVTLNLTKHFEPLGTLMMFITMLGGMGIGWGRPAPVNPSKMRNPKWDWFVSVAAGPISNFVQATIYAFFFRLSIATHAGFLGANDPFSMFLSDWILYGILINLSLAVFNLIPFGPLDGHWLVGLLMPEKMRWAWFKFNAQIGTFGLMIVVVSLGQMGVHLTSGPVAFLFQLLTGQPF